MKCQVLFSGKNNVFKVSSADIAQRVVKVRVEICQYDTDAPAQGHPYPHAGILQKMKLKNGHNS